MIQLYLSILLSLVLSTSCANTNMSKQGVKSEESVSSELQLSDVDFSAEVGGRLRSLFSLRESNECANTYIVLAKSV